MGHNHRAMTRSYSGYMASSPISVTCRGSYHLLRLLVSLIIITAHRYVYCTPRSNQLFIGLILHHEYKIVQNLQNTHKPDNNKAVIRCKIGTPIRKEEQAVGDIRLVSRMRKCLRQYCNVRAARMRYKYWLWARTQALPWALVRCLSLLNH